MDLYCMEEWTESKIMVLLTIRISFFDKNTHILSISAIWV